MFRKIFLGTSFVGIIAAAFVAVHCGGSGGGGGVGPDGGTVTSNDGKFTLTIPEGALGQTVQITITAMDAADLPTSIADMADMGFNYMLMPDGLAFSTAANGTLSLTQTEAANYLGVGGALTNMVLITDDGGELAYIDGVMAGIDQTTGNYTVSGPIDHFSYDSASNGFVSLTVKPAGVSRSSSYEDKANVDVTIRGRENFLFGEYGQISQSRFLAGTLKTIVPDFVTITPTEVEFDFSPDGQPVAAQRFEVLCTGPGDDTISFYLDKPQGYILATGTGDVMFYIEQQFGETIPVICADYIADDDETVTGFSSWGNPGTAAVGSDVSFDLSLMIFDDHSRAYVTGTVAATNIAGPSPGTIDPYPSTKYVANKQQMSFTCNNAGTTSVAFQMMVDNIQYWDEATTSFRTKNLVMNTTVPLTCTEEVPAPFGISVDDATSCQLKVDWGYTDEYNPDGFEVEREEMNVGNWAKVAEVGDVRTYTDTAATGLQLGKTYCYRVRAFKDVEGTGRVYSDYSADIDCGTKQ
jgi:hypothetical protein